MSSFGALALISYASKSNMMPSAPVENFKMPMFNAQGNKICDLQGQTGTFISNDHIDVEKMQLRIWKGDNAAALDLTIESADASIFPAENRAVGKNYIYILQAEDAYSIRGRDWEWAKVGNGDNLIHIRDGAQVTFKQTIDTKL